MSATVDAPVERVWSLLCDTGRWPEWGPSVAAVEPAATVIGPGTAGRVRTPVGVWLPFRITAFEPLRYWSWRVAGIPATGHRVEALGSGCRVTFEAPTVAFAYLVVCQQALRRVEAMVAGSAP